MYRYHKLECIRIQAICNDFAKMDSLNDFKLYVQGLLRGVHFIRECDCSVTWKGKGVSLKIQAYRVI